MLPALAVLAVAGSGCRIPAFLPPARSRPPIRGLRATGADCRVDLEWQAAGVEKPAGYRVYRSPSIQGPYRRIGPHILRVPLFSDFLGENGRRFYYRVTAIYRSGGESGPSRVVAARSQVQRCRTTGVRTRQKFSSRDAVLLTAVEQAGFRYFWDWGHPASGLARERDSSGDICACGGTGFGLMVLMIGAERGFVPRRAAARRVVKILRFLETKARRYHGAWSHWIHGRTGATIPFAWKDGIHADDGADLVETAFLVQGLLAVRRYFNKDSPLECEIRRRATQMWAGVEWDWFLRNPGGHRLYWHWSPKYHWKMNLAIGGRFNECLIVYLLAMASPTHPIPASCYRKGWIGTAHSYLNGRSWYGVRQCAGPPMGGPLFFTQYSFIGFDPRGWQDGFCNYFENNRNICRIHALYCRANPGKHAGYGPGGVWGLTSSDDPDGYRVHAPGPLDNGTIAPTAALSAMPYTPAESLAALRLFYYKYGKRLWGPFGFYDAFNLDRGWTAHSVLAIDQGPIVCMIENFRTGLCWRMFMANPEIRPALRAAGWTYSRPQPKTGSEPPARPLAVPARTTEERKAPCPRPRPPRK